MISFPRSIPEIELSRRNRLIVYYLAGLVMLVLVYTAVYESDSTHPGASGPVGRIDAR